MPYRRKAIPVGRLTLVAAQSLLVTGACLAGGQSADPASGSVPVSELARELDSPVFAEREAAARALFAAQGRALAVLLATAKEGSLEAGVRLVDLLESIYIAADAQKDGATVDAAETALDELARSAPPPVADRAEATLEAEYDIRERRALAAIEQFHGVPDFGPIDEIRNLRMRRLNPAARPVERRTDAAIEHRELRLLIIGPKWTGGDAGLKQVARLKRLKMLYRIEGAPVSDAGIARLRAALPGLEIEVRGAAKLGVGSGGLFAPTERGCLIGEVNKGEAAANAGLQRGDLILEFGGQPVENFAALITLLRRYKPGDSVDVAIRRGDVPMKVPVTLTGWD